MKDTMFTVGIELLVLPISLAAVILLAGPFITTSPDHVARGQYRRRVGEPGRRIEDIDYLIRKYKEKEGHYPASLSVFTDADVRAVNDDARAADLAHYVYLAADFRTRLRGTP